MSEQTTEILLQPDGTLFVHNLTPRMAALLAELDPENEEMRRRAQPESSPAENERVPTSL
jgi:hypothetical protein